MHSPSRGSDGRAGGTFARAAWRYWITIWPLVGGQIRQLRARADAIPDAALRAAALGNLRDERGNLEGAAAFAVLAPRATRAPLVRALVAFQAIYDYVDTLVEQADYADEPTARRLHHALLDAVDIEHPPLAHHYFGDADDPDGGYLAATITSCRASVLALPSIAVVLPHTLAAIERMVEYQVHNHGPDDHRPLATWATQQTPDDSDFTWWETAAAAASSLDVFALLALAATRGADDRAARHVADAYLPVCALHVLLDSFVDRDADAHTGDHSLIGHYPDRASEARRLATIAGDATGRLTALEDAQTHRLILTAMASFYLTAPTTDEHERLTATAVLKALGTQAALTNAVHHARRATRLAASPCAQLLQRGRRTCARSTTTTYM